MHVACSQVGGLTHTPPVASDAPGRAQAETVDRAEDFNLNVDTCSFWFRVAASKEAAKIKSRRQAEQSLAFPPIFLRIQAVACCIL